MAKKVIVADDSNDVRNSYKFMIKDLAPNTEIDEVADGGKLVEKVREHPDYDLVITDNQMILMDGLEAIPEIRKFNPKVPIYMVAGSVPGVDFNQLALSAGANGYFDKSGRETQQKLQELILKYLS